MTIFFIFVTYAVKPVYSGNQCPDGVRYREVSLYIVKFIDFVLFFLSCEYC